jgi:hypothetical protein
VKAWDFLALPTLPLARPHLLLKWGNRAQLQMERQPQDQPRQR